MYFCLVSAIIMTCLSAAVSVPGVDLGVAVVMVVVAAAVVVAL